MAHLVLYTRAGCCLCEGLEERLRALQPAPALQLVDVDADPALLARYGLEVPVLALASPIAGGEAGAATLRELPRVSPRLAGERLRGWLRLQGVG